MPRWLLVSLVAVLLGGIGVALAAQWSWRELNQPLPIPAEGLLFEIRSGAPLVSVARELQEQDILPHPGLLAWYARMQGTATGIHAGEYLLLPGLTSLSLLEKFGRGEVYLHQFTIIEGRRYEEMLARLRTHPAIVSTDSDGPAIMAALGSAGIHPEGQFLPDTYSFPRGTSDVELLRWAHDALNETLTAAWESRPADSILTDPYQGLVLASIIEKETALPSERALISAVFQSRLRQGMRLQTDPTVIYGLGEAFDGNLTRADLNRDTPYNTYTRAGLPPSPIALAGRAAITAAFNPVESDALYFVATGDPDGSHTFSRTLDEHNAAVRAYVDRQRAGNGN